MERQRKERGRGETRARGLIIEAPTILTEATQSLINSPPSSLTFYQVSNGVHQMANTQGNYLPRKGRLFGVGLSGATWDFHHEPQQHTHTRKGGRPTQLFSANNIHFPLPANRCFHKSNYIISRAKISSHGKWDKVLE